LLISEVGAFPLKWAALHVKQSWFDLKNNFFDTYRHFLGFEMGASYLFGKQILKILQGNVFC
jgi:hypothetical protein